MDHAEQNRDRTIKIFEDFWKYGSPWLLSIIGPAGVGKSLLLSTLAEKHCNDIPYALFSLELYAANIGGLLSAIFESPLVNGLISEEAFEKYQSETAVALAALNNRPLAIGNNSVQGPMTDSEQSIEMDSNLDQIAQILERYAEMRIADSWLASLRSLNKQSKMVLFFDDYDSLMHGTDMLDHFFFLGVLERAHNVLSGLRVVIASRAVLRVPKLWRNTGEAVASTL